jgi:hypothetical protein
MIWGRRRKGSEYKVVDGVVARSQMVRYKSAVRGRGPAPTNPPPPKAEAQVIWSMCYPNGAEGLVRTCHDVKGDRRMRFYLRSGREVEGFVKAIDGDRGDPVTVTLDGGRLIPWVQIDWFEVADAEG